MLNLGKIAVGNTGGLNSISYGDQSPDADAIPLGWNTGDVRYYIGPIVSLIGWRCTAGGTPGTWARIDNRSFDLFLSYGDQSGDGALPIPPEATPEFYLRPNTDKTVQMAFSGSPGATWEYEVGPDLITDLYTMSLDIYIYSCALTPAGVGPATLQIAATGNGAASILTANLDGLTNTRVTGSAISAVSPGDRFGILVTTTNVGSGFLMATAHLHIGG